MKVGVIGTGHVGLPTAAVVASLGHHVTACDSDQEKIELLSAGTAPFYEPGLQELLDQGIATGDLRFTHDPGEVVQGRDVVFICVGTPPQASGEADLRAVEQAGDLIATHADGPVVVVEKSTVPAGTAERVASTLRRRRKDVRLDVVSNPEFMREGRAVEDALRPDRILVGSDSARALEVMRVLYRPVLDTGVRWIETDLRTAELAKHACNAFLALKISYANALARICERSGADVTAVADVMGSDPRIGRAFLDAGLGYGGYCFPKDLAAFAHLCQRIGYAFPLLGEIARINDEAVETTYRLVQEATPNLEGKRIALLGLAFKPETDDVRFSPALALGKKLIGAGAVVVGYDPRANAAAKVELPELELAADPYEALRDAHCAVLCTEWDEFRALDLGRARDLMALPVLVDGRNALPPQEATREGFTYLPLGRPAAGSPRR